MKITNLCKNNYIFILFILIEKVLKKCPQNLVKIKHFLKAYCNFKNLYLKNLHTYTIEILLNLRVIFQLLENAKILCFIYSSLFLKNPFST